MKISSKSVEFSEMFDEFVGLPRLKAMAADAPRAGLSAMGTLLFSRDGRLLTALACCGCRLGRNARRRLQDDRAAPRPGSARALRRSVHPVEAGAGVGDGGAALAGCFRIAALTREPPPCDVFLLLHVLTACAGGGLTRVVGGAAPGLLGRHDGRDILELAGRAACVCDRDKAAVSRFGSARVSRRRCFVLLIRACCRCSTIVTTWSSRSGSAGSCCASCLNASIAGKLAQPRESPSSVPYCPLSARDLCCSLLSRGTRCAPCAQISHRSVRLCAGAG